MTNFTFQINLFHWNCTLSVLSSVIELKLLKLNFKQNGWLVFYINYIWNVYKF